MNELNVGCFKIISSKCSHNTPPSGFWISQPTWANHAQVFQAAGIAINTYPYFDAANDQTLFVVLIEDIVAVNNLDEILEVDNIDVFFVAPSDLAASMGLIGQWDHPDVVATRENALKKIVQSGRTAGTLTNNDNVARFTELGVRFLMTGVGDWIDTGAAAFKTAAHIN